jgi:hypothetical protein
LIDGGETGGNLSAKEPDETINAAYLRDQRAWFWRLVRGWVEGLPELPDKDEAEMALAAVDSILSRLEPKTGSELLEWHVFDSNRKRLEALLLLIAREDAEGARKFVRALEVK